jgi:hypothetical protein
VSRGQDPDDQGQGPGDDEKDDHPFEVQPEEGPEKRGDENQGVGRDFNGIDEAETVSRFQGPAKRREDGVDWKDDRHPSQSRPRLGHQRGRHFQEAGEDERSREDEDG